jgi:predicted CoA-substrate-specific enzyme activase
MSLFREYGTHLQYPSNRPRVGYTCSYVPLEVIYAAGFLPWRIVGRTDLCNHVDPALSCNLCPYVHSILKAARGATALSTAARDSNTAMTTREAIQTTPVVIVDSCDAMRKLYDALKLEIGQAAGQSPLYLLSVPRKSDERAVSFFAQQLEDLLAFLSGVSAGGLPAETHKKLKGSQALYERLRRILGEIRQLMSHEKLSEYLEFKQRILDMDPAQTLPALEKMRQDMPCRNAHEASRRSARNSLSCPVTVEGNPTQVVVSGSPVPGTQILSVIEEAGFKIVLNDSCLDERWDGSLSGKSSEGPFFSLARAYLEKIPCARMMGRERFLEQLPGHARNRGLAGLIQLRMPFCDLYGFDFVRLLRYFSKEQVLQIETDGSETGIGQAKTRINAFFEILGGKNHRSGRREQKMESKIFCGLDIGSTTVDGVLLDARGRILAWGIEKTGPGPETTTEKLFGEMVARSGISERDIAFIMATGYGREGLGFTHGRITEISCHARGVQHLIQGVRLVIDIGGQDCKVIRIDETGDVRDFQMNDKCAAGTGRFLEVMAGALGVSLEEMGRYGMSEGKTVPVSSVCTVFAESEVVSMIGRGIKAPDITRGLYQSIINRIEAMVRRVGFMPPVAVTGGGALNRGLVHGLEKRLGTTIAVPDNPQLVGAIGAALYGMRERGLALEAIH